MYEEESEKNPIRFQKYTTLPGKQNAEEEED